MAETKLFYEEDACKGKTAEQVADMIVAWRADDEQLADSAFDLLNAIEPWLRDAESCKELLDNTSSLTLDSDEEIYRGMTGYEIDAEGEAFSDFQYLSILSAYQAIKRGREV